MGISTVGPECFVVSSENVDPLHTATQRIEAAESLVERSNEFVDIDRINSHIAKLDETRTSLKALRDGATVTGFYVEHFAEKFRTDIAKKLEEIDEAEESLYTKHEDVENFHEKRKARQAEVAAKEAEERAAQALAEEERIAREAAQAADTVADPEYGQPEVIDPAPQPMPESVPAPAPAPVDTYTGCRAYGGNYAMTSMDEQGRPYAKIDCSTRQQIG